MPVNRPHPRRRQRRPASRCATTGKVCYTAEGAVTALVSMQQHETDPDPFRPLHAYHCAHCGRFHVGHRPWRLMHADPSATPPKGATE